MTGEIIRCKECDGSGQWRPPCGAGWFSPQPFVMTPLVTNPAIPEDWTCVYGNHGPAVCMNLGAEWETVKRA